MNDQPLDDDGELLRSLKPTQPEINWQYVLSHLPASSAVRAESVAPLGQSASPSITTMPLPDQAFGQPRIKNIVGSWWSGALVGSLVTLALIRWMGIQPVSNDREDIPIAGSLPIPSNKPQRSIENTSGAIAHDLQNQSRSLRDSEMWDSIVDIGNWSYRFKRHGVGERLVSKSPSGPTRSLEASLLSPNVIDGQPKSQAEFCRELLRVY